MIRLTIEAMLTLILVAAVATWAALDVSKTISSGPVTPAGVPVRYHWDLGARVGVLVGGTAAVIVIASGAATGGARRRKPASE